MKTAKPLTLNVGDWILLRDKKIKIRKLVQATGKQVGLTEPTDSAKFQSDWLGPYKVTKVLTNAVTIDDTDRNELRAVSIANVKFFHVQDKDEQPLPKENKSSEDNLKDDDLDSTDPLKLYVIDRILDFRRSKKGHEYLIKWEGYDSSHNSWTKSSNIQGEDALMDFWSNNASKYPIQNIPVKYRKYFSKERGVSVRDKRQPPSRDDRHKRRRY